MSRTHSTPRVRRRKKNNIIHTNVYEYIDIQTYKEDTS